MLGALSSFYVYKPEQSYRFLDITKRLYDQSSVQFSDLNYIITFYGNTNYVITRVK